jgi:lipoprotein-anchoring transpeptidase ErfK/SrfK
MFGSVISRLSIGASIAASAALIAGAANAQVLNFAPAPAYPNSIFQPAIPQERTTQEETSTALPEHLRRQIVSYRTSEAPGTIVIDTPNTHLYFVLGGGRAIRYGIGVGREGFTWSGVKTVGRKAEWPDWIPPQDMLERQPYLPRFMAGGPGNPLGARAMYLAGTVYRIHGTNAPSSIGQNMSSGCIRMLNEDVIDLYERVKLGAKVVVLPDGPRKSRTAGTARPRNITTAATPQTRVY